MLYWQRSLSGAPGARSQTLTYQFSTSKQHQKFLIKRRKKKFYLNPLSIAISLILAHNSIVYAQITPDGSLGEESSIVTPGQLRDLIEGGAIRDSSLFHSFLEFNIQEGQQVYFTNPEGITNIFTRVTGINPSDIFGTLGVDGSANLILINPHGINFGANAQLDITGSFFATTTESIIFANGWEFSANNPQAPPLLQVNLTPGLQTGSPAQAPINNAATLSIATGQTLTLIGSEINFTGSAVAPGGNVELLGSQINLFAGATIDVTDIGRGNITIAADQLTMTDSSQLLAGINGTNSFITAQAGDIVIDAANISIANSSVIANTLATDSVGNGGNVQITTDNLALNSGSRIQTVTEGNGTAGDIIINASETIDISGFSNDGLLSGILSHTASANSGAGGKIHINQGNLSQGRITLSDRGFIATVTNSSNHGGGVNINANDLTLQSGGQIVTLATNSGHAGNIYINTPGNLTLSGSSTDFLPSPFDDLTVFSLDELNFRSESNPDVAESGTGGIPYVSVSRTPEQIISDNTVLGTATDNTFDYYSFTITAADSRGVFDIDYGSTAGDGKIDTEIFLFNQLGDVLASNDDASVTAGAQGSTLRPLRTVSQDSFIATTFSEPGTYVVGVGEFDTAASSFTVLEGNTVDLGDTYTLQVSLENQGINNNADTTATLNREHFNPNQGGNSGLFSITQTEGNGGNIKVSTAQMLMQQGAEVSITTLGEGKGGYINLSATGTIAIDDSVISTATRGAGDAGNIRLTANDIHLTNGGQLDASTFSSGDAGTAIIDTQNHISIDGESSRGFRSSILSRVNSVATGQAGGIQIDTGSVSVTNGAFLSVNTRGSGDAGKVTLNARDTIHFDGKSIDGFLSGAFSVVNSTGVADAGGLEINTGSLILSNGASFGTSTIGQGDAGQINISAESLSVTNESFIASDTRRQGNADNINIFVTEQIFLDNGLINSGVTTTGVGNGGNIAIHAPLIFATNQSAISALSEGEGAAGSVEINANEFILDYGSQAIVSSQGNLDAGNLEINANRVSLDNQASISAETFAGGGGSISLVNLDTLRLDNNSTISASTVSGQGGTVSIAANHVFVSGGSGLLSEATAGGVAGNLEISAEQINFTSGAQATVSSPTGQAGNLILSTDYLLLDNGKLAAETGAGVGGANINLQVSDLVRLDNASLISANATGSSDGGNVNIDAQFVVAPPLQSNQGSDIVANAQFGNGGLVTINTQALFGIEFRPFNTPGNDITASSQFGNAGMVEITRPNLTPAPDLMALPSELVNSNGLIARNCNAVDNEDQGSQFIITGRGGLPTTPEELLRGGAIVTEWVTLPAQEQEYQITNSPAIISEQPQTVTEAKGWVMGANGNPILTAEANHTQIDIPWLATYRCAAQG